MQLEIITSDCIDRLDISTPLPLLILQDYAELHVIHLISAGVMRHDCGGPMLQEAASGEQMSTLQKELEQLHTSAGHMKGQIDAAQQSQIDAQVPDSCLAAIAMLAMRLALLRSCTLGISITLCHTASCADTSPFLLCLLFIDCLLAMLIHAID